MAIVAGVHITDLLNVTKDNIPRKPVITPCFIEYNLYDEQDIIQITKNANTGCKNLVILTSDICVMFEIVAKNK